MLRSYFDENPESLFCQKCGSNKGSLIENLNHPGGGVRCGQCNAFICWLSTKEKENKRPYQSKQSLDDVWSKFGNRCADCGLSIEELERLGIPITVQHSPPLVHVDYDDSKCQHIPFCKWCQDDSSRNMARFKALVKRVAYLKRMP